MFVWGDGLVMAYLMERKEAIYPRIIHNMIKKRKVDKILERTYRRNNC